MIIITSLLQRGNWVWKVICSKLHILIWGRFRNWTYACVITNYSNWPSWHGHLWRIQSWGQSCPLYRGGGGRHPHIHMANCQEGPPEWRWQTLNSIRFSKWQVTRYMKGNNDKALSFSKCSNIISWEARVKSIRPCLHKRSREFNNLLKIAKPIIDGAGTRIQFLNSKHFLFLFRAGGSEWDPWSWELSKDRGWHAPANFLVWEDTQSTSVLPGGLVHQVFL